METSPNQHLLSFEAADIGVLDGLGRVVLSYVLVCLVDGLGRRQIDVDSARIVPVVGDGAPGYALSYGVLADTAGIRGLSDGPPVQVASWTVLSHARRVDH